MRLIDANKFIEKVNRDRKHECYIHCWTADDVLKRLDSWYAPTINAIVIPDNATNGDIIKVMFPNIEAKAIKTSTGGYIEVKYLDTTDECDATAFRKDWWNASYKGE